MRNKRKKMKNDEFRSTSFAEEGGLAVKLSNQADSG